MRQVPPEKPDTRQNTRPLVLSPVPQRRHPFVPSRQNARDVTALNQQRQGETRKCSMPFSVVVCAEFENNFFNPVAWCVESPRLLDAKREPAFFQNAERGDIVFRDMGVKGARLDSSQEFGERLRGNALTPEVLSNPVADEWLSVPFPADDITRHVSVEEDGLFRHGLIAQDLFPMRHEGIPCPGRKGGHLVGVRVALLLEEYGEVGVGHVSQANVARMRRRSVSGPIVVFIWPGRRTGRRERPYGVSYSYRKLFDSFTGSDQTGTGSESSRCLSPFWQSLLARGARVLSRKQHPFAHAAPTGAASTAVGSPWWPCHHARASRRVHRSAHGHWARACSRASAS